MGPVITAESRERIHGLVEQGLQEGAKLLLDGREKEVDGFRNGYFVHPTVLDDVNPASTVVTARVPTSLTRISRPLPVAMARLPW